MRRAFAILAGLASAAAGDYGYEIAEYRAAFEQVGGGPDVKATLDITYDVFGKPKSGGFKYVGKSVVESLKGFDEKGAPLNVRVLRQRETRLEWEFPAIERGRKKIKVEFVLKHFLYRHGGACRLDAPWAGVFRVPVRRGRYELAFPPRHKADVKAVDPRYYSTETSGGRRTIVVAESPLSSPGFSVDFACSLPQTAGSRRHAASGRSPAMVWLFVFGGIGVLALIWYVSKRSKDSAGGGSADSWATSGCGGGGCGGGGCGGGCGG